jgi:hypothetical protein
MQINQSSIQNSADDSVSSGKQVLFQLNLHKMLTNVANKAESSAVKDSGINVVPLSQRDLNGGV